MRPEPQQLRAVDPDATLPAIADALWQTDITWPPHDDEDYLALRTFAH